MNCSTNTNNGHRLHSPSSNESDNDCSCCGSGHHHNHRQKPHVGILYSADDEGSFRLLHLRWYQWPEDVPFDDGSYLFADPSMAEEDSEIVAGHCRLIAKNMPNVRFSINFNPKASIVSSTKSPAKLVAESKGLNCSTWVLAIFKHAGPALIDFRVPKRIPTFPGTRNCLSTYETTETYRKRIGRASRKTLGVRECVLRNLPRMP